MRKTFTEEEIKAYENEFNNDETLNYKEALNRDPSIAGNPEIALASLTIDNGFYDFNIRYFSDDLKENKQFMLAVNRKLGHWQSTGEIEKHDGILDHVSEELANDRDFVLDIVKHHPESFYKVKDKFTADPEIASLAVVNSGGRSNMLDVADVSLLSNKEFMVAAVSASPDFYKKASFNLKNDPLFNIQCVKAEPESLGLMSDEMKAHKYLVMQAVTKQGAALRHADPSLRSDSEVVGLAVARNGNAIRHAGFAQRDDKDMALTALKTKPEAFEHLSERLRDDTDVLHAAVTHKDSNPLQIRSWLGPKARETYRHADTREDITEAVEKRFRTEQQYAKLQQELSHKPSQSQTRSLKI